MKPIPYDEPQRLASLQALEILDTPADPAFDRITRLAAQQFDVPIALISLVDSARQWFKSKVGLVIDETPRDVSFCQFAIMDSCVMQVPDATKDPRFADNPLVTGEPYIRFYAGAPLSTANGFRLGTLCLIDTKARPALKPEQEEQLLDLAALAIREMEHCRLHRLLGALAFEREGGPADAATELRNPEDTLAQQAQMDVMAHIAHELRTPLGAILGFAEVIRRQHFGAVGDPRYANYAEQIEACGRHLLDVLTNTIDLARASTGGLDLIEAEVNVEETIRLAEKLCWNELEKYQVGLEVAVDPVVPPLLADQCQLTQMLVNLICNAVRHAPSQSVVTVRAGMSDSGCLDLSVVDKGCGMTPQAVQTAMAPFGRVSGTADRDHAGLGIGLPLTRRLIAMHSGELIIDSEPGHGTRINLRFPAFRVCRIASLAGARQTA